MSNSYFRFKQFTVKQDRCAMKVSTDSVLLGAWVPLHDCKQILDVGTGSGIIALSLAQRNQNAIITGIEIDKEAAFQALSNFRDSPWEDRLKLIHGDFCIHEFPNNFDLIISNPPYFINSFQSPDTKRNIARHNYSNFNYELLFSKSSKLLRDCNGRLAIIIPTSVLEIVHAIAAKYSFYPTTQTNVFSKKGQASNRTLLVFSLNGKPEQNTNLYLYDESGSFSAEYIELTKDFYLNF